MAGQARVFFAEFEFRRSPRAGRETRGVRERRCNCCGERMDGLAFCWNPGCADSVHDGVTAGWPPGGQVIVTTGKTIA